MQFIAHSRTACIWLYTSRISMEKQKSHRWCTGVKKVMYHIWYTIFLYFFYLDNFFLLFSGKFVWKSSLSAWPALPCRHWLSTPLPCWFFLHRSRTKGSWWMHTLPPWTVLWQSCNSRAFTSAPVSGWVNTTITLLLFNFKSTLSQSG